MPDLDRRTLVAYLAAGLLVLVLAGRWYTTRGGERDGVRAGSAPAPGVTLDRAPEPDAVVHVAGAVRRPGVYRLAPGSRVRDAVERAGGPGPRADTAALNLAAKIADGQQVLLPERAPRAAAGAPAAPAAGGPVSLNAATPEQLDGLDGVGPDTAAKIVEFRRRRGGLASVDDLDEIPGIGPKKLEALRGQVTP